MGRPAPDRQETLGVKFRGRGSRSTFRTGAVKRTKYPREVCARALAHDIMSKVEATYACTTFVQQGRQLMQDWAKLLS